jgi:hypothetical protein
MADGGQGLTPGAHWQATHDEHPTEDAWEQLACGELSGPERMALLDHVLECSECTILYRELVTFEHDARSFDPGIPAAGGLLADAPVPRAWRWGRWGLGGALAAAAALVLFIGVRPQLIGVRPQPTGTPPSGETLRSDRHLAETPVPLAPLGIVAPPESFTWEPVPGAVRYRLELLDAAGEIVGSAATAETRVTWPGERPRLPGRYYWRVVAELERGGTSSSELEDFEIRDLDLDTTVPEGSDETHLDNDVP